VELASAFYEFEAKAKKFGFFVPELDRMADSLEDMRPFKSSNALKESAKIIAEENEHEGKVIMFKPVSGPLFNENDELVAAL
jgi:hypothetical protein